jgi:hypothetical protein
MATLTGQNIANTYKQLLQVGSDNTGLTSTVQTVQDGNGTNSALQLSQSAVNINGTFQLNGSTLTATASALNAVPNLTSYTGFIAVSSSSINGRTLTAGTGVSISNGNGTAGDPVIALNTTGVVSGSYGPATNFAVNAVGQIVSATAAASVSVSAVTANTFVGGTFEGTTANFSSNVSVGGDLIIGGQFTPAALSVTGTINAGTISATDATFNNIVSAAFFVGDGSGLINVPSAEGGTVKAITAGTGIKLTVNAAVTTTMPVSGTVAVSANQNFGTVSVSTALAVTGSALFGIVSATNIDTDELLIAGVSAATVTEVAAVSALTQTNLDSITSINIVVANVSALTSVNAAAITSINIVVANVSALTSVNAAAITSINSVVANVSALTSVNAAAITSINSVIDAFDFATSAELAAVSVLTSINAAAITSINSVVANVSALTSVNSAAITSINTVVDAVSAATSVNAAAITSINTVVDAVSAATSVNSAAITSINTVVDAVSAATSVNAAAITSINTVVDAVSAATSVNAAAITSINTVVANLSSTLATSIANHLPLAGGTLTGTVSGTDFYVSAVAIGVDTLLGKQLHIGTAAVADIVSLTDGTSIAVDFNAGQNFAVQLAGNRTLESPSNCVAGQTGSIFVIQDGTGSRTLSYGGSWKFPAGTAPTLSTAISAVDRIDYIAYTSTAVHAIATLDVK